MKFDAFFISPQGDIIPVPVRHIVAIANKPETFGLTGHKIKEVYAKYKEAVGWEGYARNEIILELLKNNWVRIRFFIRSGTWRIQIFEELNELLKNNILKFCQEIKCGNISNLMDRTAEPNIEIHNTKDRSLVNGTLDEIIEKFSPQRHGDENIDIYEINSKLRFQIIL